MDLESQLDQAKQARVDYEAEVSDHFAQTADLLHKLTDDYRSVYAHLADGAEQLCGDRVNISDTCPHCTLGRDLGEASFGGGRSAAGLCTQKTRRAGSAVRGFRAGQVQLSSLNRSDWVVDVHEFVATTQGP
jgi:hypothetical protein